MSSACEVLLEDPERYLNYVLNDPNVRNEITDEATFTKAVRKVFNADASLKNLVGEIDKKGENLEICVGNIFNSKAVQEIVKKNVGVRRTMLRKRVKKQRPSLRGKALSKEISRRLKISLSRTQGRVDKIPEQQITIIQSLKSVKVDSYIRDGQVVKAYNRTKSRDLTLPERMLIENNIDKTVEEVQTKYYAQGFVFRSPTSIKRHYYRIKSKS